MGKSLTLMKFKHWFLLASGIFVFGMLLGIVAPADLLPEDVSMLEETAQSLAGLPLLAIFIFILINNVLAVTLSFALSPFLGVVPVIALLINGWILTVVAVDIAAQESVGYVLAGILPHGIFEIPAFIMAQAAAISFAYSVVAGVFDREKRGEIQASFRLNIRYVGAGLVLMIPAAAIETFVTPMLLD